MAVRRDGIDGIYIEINGNFAKFEDSLRGVNKAIAVLKKDFTTLNKSLRFDPTNMEALKRQLTNVSQQMELNEDRAKGLKEELAKLDEAGLSGGEQYINLQNSLANTEIRGKELATMLERVKQGIADADNPNSFNNLNKQLRETKAELELVNQRLDLDPSDIDLAARKAELLEKATGLADKKVEALKNEMKNVSAGDMGEADARKLRIELDKAEVEAGQLKAEIDNVDGALGDAKTGAGKFKTELGAELGGNLLSSGIQALVSATGDLAGEAIAASDSLAKFESTMGFAGFDAEAIDTAKTAVKDYADSTVYDLQTVSNTTAQLAANGVDDYVGLTQAAGNLNAVAGGSADTFQSMAMVMTQTAGSGKLTTENWNQLADAIPGASGRLQEALLAAGAYTGDFREAMARGEITADEFNAAVMQLGNEPVAVEAAQSVSTFEGAFGNLEATAVSGITNIIDTIGAENITGAITGISDVVSGLLDAIASVINFVKENKDVLTALGIAVGVVTAAYVAWQVAQGVSIALTTGKTLADNAGTVATTAHAVATKAAAAQQAVLNAVMNANPIAIIITLIAALVAALVWFFTQTEEGRKLLQSFCDFFVGVFQDAVDFFVGLWNGVVDFAVGIWNSIVEFFTNGVNNALAVVSGIQDAVVGFFTGIPDAVWGAISGMLDFGSKIVDGIIQGFLSLGTKIMEQVQGAIDGAVGFLRGIPLIGELFKGGSLTVAMQGAGLAPYGSISMDMIKSLGTMPYVTKASSSQTTLSISVNAQGTDATEIARAVERVIVRNIK